MMDQNTSPAPQARENGEVLEDDIVRALARVLKRDVETLTPELGFFEDLAFDSTTVLEVLMQMEDDLGVEIEPENLEQSDLETVGSLVKFIITQLHDRP
jgi:acyl carrier protein